jgi:hypothetical protein
MYRREWEQSSTLLCSEEDEGEFPFFLADDGPTWDRRCRALMPNYFFLKF